MNMSYIPPRITIINLEAESPLLDGSPLTASFTIGSGEEAQGSTTAGHSGWSNRRVGNGLWADEE